jgi:hypothetical protein
MSWGALIGFLRRLFGGDRPPDPDAVQHLHLDDPAMEAPGWDAIDRALDAQYGDQEPQHYGTIVKFALGGPDPLDGVSIYRHDGPPAHWHYASYGLSELFQKESDDLERSGWGIELTFRLRRGADAAAPIWPVNFMQNLARYVFESGNVLLPNHHLDTNGPIAAESDTELQAVVCVRDPELGEISTPNGNVTFVQLVGITLDELAAIKAWSSAAFLGLWQETNPLLVTDLDRAPLLADATFSAEVTRRTEAEGSTLSGLNVDQLAWASDGGGVRVSLGAYAIEGIADLLRRRPGRGLDGWVQGRDALVVFHAGDAWDVVTEDDVLTLTMPATVAVALAGTLRPEVGTYAVPAAPGLVVAVEETIVRDAKGNEIESVGQATRPTASMYRAASSTPSTRASR